ncbi:Gfo/Idh/MocA family oxidoreductase [Mesorhizobium sp. B2-4-15]|uniref:Gfo/Idh/MocA family protein n=1 Tax=Mesorhizobium sp. B2-4-15 TaxID=2589934 RepID=UPI00114F8E1E|nr:Gfo/Idh/MocA family oxidoreductase [Mesorhizobium sp. B2-4-15]TPK73594.1 Gfo/Idh/MocA family oxidoreductase [Mesorhizobium sp. B2-4-15]
MAIGIGIVGTGLVAELHMPAIAAVEGVRAVAVADIAADRAKDFAARYNLPAHYADLRSFLADPQIDAVIVGTPNRYHTEVAIEAAAMGKHILCEKPITHDLVSGAHIIEACAKAGGQLHIGFNQRYANTVTAARNIIQSGLIGEIKSFRSVFSEKWDEWVDIDNFRYDRKLSGGDGSYNPSYRPDQIHAEPGFHRGLRHASTQCDACTVG